MSYTMKKAVSEIITVLKKYPEPGKKSGSFWEFMKNQLADEGEWDQKHLKIIESEIDKHLSKVDKKSLIEMWKHTGAASNIDAEPENLSVKELKSDVTDELLGQIMDKMDDNYSTRENFYAPSENYYPAEKEDNKTELGEDADFDDNSEPEEIQDEDFDLDNSDFYDEDDQEDDY